MSFPGMPGRAFGGAGSDTAGMSDQEAMMVRSVSLLKLTPSTLSDPS